MLMKINKRAYARSIVDRLVCGHCSAMFAGTQKQAERSVYNNTKPFCSETCRKAYMSNLFSTPVPNHVCKQCNKMFFTRRNKPQFCSMDCYTKSSQFSAMLKEARDKSFTQESIGKRAACARTGTDIECLECKQMFYVQIGQIGKKRFCSRPCFRSYMNKRYDRQIASPDKLQLPQGYDGFLDREQLNCLVDGCGWVGKHLSTHMNIAHGIKADEFKRAAGFNKNTGVISKDLAESYSKRALVGVAVHNPYKLENMRKLKGKSWVKSYHSNEAKEHARKARMFLGEGPKRTCKGCGIEFNQSSPMGRAFYCCATCRDTHYSNERKKTTVPWHLRERNPDGTFKILTQVNANG